MPLERDAVQIPPARNPRLLIVTDAWAPQISGVVRTYEWLARELPQLGVDVHFITPEGYRTLPMPTYPEIRLSLVTAGMIARRIETIAPDMIHIATEGPLGIQARKYCVRKGRAFTTCYHTRYPEYMAARFPVPLSWTYGFLRRFHNSGRATLVATDGLAAELAAHGFDKVRHWRRGIDLELFADGPAAELDLPRPIFLFVGRLAVEKNLEDFLDLDLPGSKVVVGDGPARAELERKYPQAKFLGAMHGQPLGAVYRAADAFVFPSLTDTFGLVMAEALAAGTPVAAFPSAGAEAIFGDEACGVLDGDLRKAALAALNIDRDACRRAGQRHSMRDSAMCFLDLVDRAHRHGAAGEASFAPGFDPAAKTG